MDAADVREDASSTRFKFGDGDGVRSLKMATIPAYIGSNVSNTTEAI